MLKKILQVRRQLNKSSTARNKKIAFKESDSNIYHKKTDDEPKPEIIPVFLGESLVLFLNSMSVGTFFYFPIRARNMLPQLIADFGKLDVKFVYAPPANWRQVAPFEQAPYFELPDGKVFSQSMTIAR